MRKKERKTENVKRENTVAIILKSSGRHEYQREQHKRDSTHHKTTKPQNTATNHPTHKANTRAHTHNTKKQKTKERAEIVRNPHRTTIAAAGQSLTPAKPASEPFEAFQTPCVCIARPTHTQRVFVLVVV